METCYNEHANNEFYRYNEHNFASTHVKIITAMCNASNEFIVITYEFLGSLEHSVCRVSAVHSFTVNWLNTNPFALNFSPHSSAAVALLLHLCCEGNVAAGGGGCTEQQHQ